jgi:hypothetical protein
MTRTEHVEWAKQRALEYLDRGELGNAVASMTSDLLKHPETAASVTMEFLIVMTCHTSDDVRRWIMGFQ